MKRLLLIVVGLSLIFLPGFVTQSQAAGFCFTGSINTPFEKYDLTGTLRVHDVGSGGLLVTGELFPKNSPQVIDGFIPYEGSLSYFNGKLLLTVNANYKVKFGSFDYFSHIHAIVEISLPGLHGVGRGDMVTVSANNQPTTHEYIYGSGDITICP